MMTRLARRWILCSLLIGSAWVVEGTAQQMYDEFGYNYAARRFWGLYENADRDRGNNSDDPTHLRMDWNELFDVVRPELSQPGGWVTNVQSGSTVGRDGRERRWQYSVKIVYTGPGSPAWGYFTLQDQRYSDDSGSPTPRHKPPLLPVPAQ